MKFYQVMDSDDEEIGLYSTIRPDALSIIEKEIEDAFENNEQHEADIILTERGIERIFVENVYI